MTIDLDVHINYATKKEGKASSGLYCKKALNLFAGLTVACMSTILGLDL